MLTATEQNISILIMLHAALHRK